MSSFDIAVPVLLKIEGNGEISNDPEDPGGLTKWGISQRYNPDLDIAYLTREDAIAYYQKTWWKPIYEQISSQNVATKLLVLAVNMGVINAGFCLQNAIRAASGVILTLDGIIGSQTVQKANECISTALLAAFKSEAACHYRMNSKPKFLNGLLNRAYQ